MISEVAVWRSRTSANRKRRWVAAALALGALCQAPLQAQDEAIDEDAEAGARIDYQEVLSNEDVAEEAEVRGFLSADALANRCADQSATSASYCFAYIAAVNDAVRSYEVWLQQREFCPPAEGLVQADVRRAFLTFLDAYPEYRTGQAASVIVVALRQTYPCLGSSPRP